MNSLFLIDTTHGEIWYSITYFASIILAVAIAFYSGCKKGYPRLPWLLVIMTGGLFFILGEKIASFSSWEWSHFFTSFEVPRTEKKTILGGILGLLVGLMLGKVWLRFHRPVMDHFAVALPLGMAISRVGCLFAGCCFGTPAGLPWSIHYDISSRVFHVHTMQGLVHLQDHASAAIHPVQAYELLGCLLIVMIIGKTRKYWKAGENLFLFSVVCYAVLRFLVEFVRAPESGFVLAQPTFGLKSIQWVILAVTGVLLLVLFLREKWVNPAANGQRTLGATVLRQQLLVAFFCLVTLAGLKWFTTTERSLILLFLVPVCVYMIYAACLRLGKTHPKILGMFLWFCAPFSRVINRINWRFGRPFRCGCRHIDPVRAHLQPGTVILTHKKYEFTTFFIPGYWTHSALVVSPGHVIEATGKGVCLNTMETFFSSVDDFMVLKPCFCCPETMKKAGVHASALVGLPYSFDFRNSDKVFYCSGLICWVYVKTLADTHQSEHIPFVLQDFLNGKIIMPTDLYAHPDGWQVIGSFMKDNHHNPITVSIN